MTTLPMWRRFQVLPFTALALAVSLLLTFSMFGLAYLLFLNLFAQAFTRSLLTVLAVLAVVFVVLTLLTLTQLTYVTYSGRHDRDQEERARRWEADLRAYAAGGPAPAALDPIGRDTLLLLRETLGDSPEGTRLVGLYGDLGARAQDERLARTARHPNVRAFALERLALLRDPASLPVFGDLLTSGRSSLRTLALIAAARTLAASGADPLWLLGPLTSGRFTGQQVREAVVLLGGRAGPLIRGLTGHGEAALREIAADGAARLDARTYGDVAAHLLGDDHPDVRASALRLYAAGAPLSPGDPARLLALAADPAWPVRAQTARALARLQPLPGEALWSLLGDRNWWVRRNAAATLASLAPGRALLESAAASHPDSFAQDMARATLGAIT